MAAKIKTLFDKLGNKLYPKTKTSAVYDDNNVTLNVSLNNYAHFIDEQSTTPISNPTLYRSDIDTSTLSESDVKVPSSNLVKTNIDTLNSDLAVHTINQNSSYTGVNQTINAGSSYTAPADGLYSVELSGSDGSTGVIYLDSNRSKPLVLNKSSDLIGVLLPLKQGAIIYTRNTYGSYYVNGYVH